MLLLVGHIIHFSLHQFGIAGGIDSKNEKLKKFSDRIYNEIMKIDRVHLNGDKESVCRAT
ncbi:hypothetical protein LEA_04738 [human gut metagenome]|uniref:Uncharacterized protein n=1 Tax=human gut metagenome TaxID=408170 RepID=K1U262_9ZZZZ